MKNLIAILLILIGTNKIYSQDNQIPPPIDKKTIENNIQLNSVQNDTNILNGKNNISFPKASIKDYLIISKDFDTVSVDTTLNIKKYYKMNYLRKDDFKLIPFSNTGQGYNNLTYFPKNSLGTDFLQSNKLPGFEEFDEVSYYYTPTPFTELMYRSVFEQGQILDAIFTVNTSEKLNFSISRKGLRSLGNYQNYISNSSNFKVTTNYISENDKFGFRAHYSSQKLYGEQNGGISELDINNFENGNSQFLDRGVFDPQFENAHNELIGKRFYFDSFFHLKRKDSTNNLGIKIYNSFFVQKKFYKYQQSSPVDFFGPAYESQEINDKIHLNQIDFELGANFNLEKLGKFLLAFRSMDDKYRTENYQLADFQIPHNIKSTSTFLKFEYFVTLKFADIKIKSSSSIAGNTKASKTDLIIKHNFKNKNKLLLKFKTNNYPSSYASRAFSSNYENYNWSNNFKNIRSKSINLKLELNNIFNLNFNFTGLENFVLFERILSQSSDDTLTVGHRQLSDKINLISFELSRDFIFGDFTLDSKILLQKNLSDQGVNIPNFLSRNSIYYSTYLFDRALFLQTGLGVKYFSKYYMSGYDPITSQLFNQNQKKIGNFPILDFFINAKIQQTRIYFKFEHFNSSLTGYNFYSAPNYPFRDFSFRFGLVWNFFS